MIRENLAMVLNNCEVLDTVVRMRIILSDINVIDTKGDIGLYFEEKAESETLFNNHPTMVKPAIKIKR